MKSEEKLLPIDHLSPKVSEIFSRLVSLNIQGEVEKGLNPLIKFADDIHNVAGIECDCFSTNNAFVYISKPYCQMLWIICNIALRIHDSASVCECLERMSEVEKQNFYEELSLDCSTTRYLKELIDWSYTLNVVAELGELIKGLLNKSIDFEQIRKCKYTSDIYSEIGKKTNSLYCFGVSFILAHEFSHYTLGHNLNTYGTIDDERAADHSAFWSMYTDLSGEEKSTAMMGVICALTSLLFVNPTLEKDGIHPQENERIFEFYDIVLKDTSQEKSMQMLIMLLTTWAVCCEINDFPKVGELKASVECLNEMREYLANRAMFAPFSPSPIYRNFTITAYRY